MMGQWDLCDAADRGATASARRGKTWGLTGWSPTWAVRIDAVPQGFVT